MKLNSRRVGYALVLPPLLVAIAIAAHAAPYPSPADWRNENIYQIFTDRFNDGNPSNDNVEASRGEPYAPANSRGINGGDFKGIQDKLDYIKALGATAIWISPIPLNVGNGSSAYHGYAAQDFNQLAPHWGTMADLSNMVQAAHARGIKVILDVVCNHTGPMVTSTDPGWPNFLAPPNGYNLQYINPANQHAPPFNPTNVIPPLLSTIFHTNGYIQDFGNTQQVVLGELSGLDDLATETTYVRTNMMNIYTNWVGRADFDAFRVDTAKHVDYGFWQYWCPQMRQFGSSIGKSNFIMFGETFDGSESLVGSYTGTEGGGPFKFDSMLDYPLYFTINPVFSQAYGDTAQIENHYNAIAANYDTNAWYRLITFLDNHDNARFLSPGNANGNTNRLSVALKFLYTSRGIPCLYYGTEQAFNGTGDPNNREDMFAGEFEQGPSLGDNFDEAHPLFQLVARLNNFRRLYPALRTGIHNNLWSDPNGPGLFAYSRVLSNQEVFVCFNTASVAETLTNRATTYAPGTVLVNLLNTNDTIVVTTALGTNATPLITVPSMTAKIYIAQSLVLPLDPVIVSQSPSHAATCVAPSAPIVLQFSKPMNTNSVQAVFAVTPTATGTFTWNAIHDTMTFTPSSPWPALTTNFVHLATNAVDSVSGNSFFAPFDTFFVTFTTNTITTSSSPPAGGTTSGGGVVNCGSNVTVCATPNACYNFLYWSQNGSLVSTTACYTLSLTGNVGLVANFVNGQGTLATDNAADPAYSGNTWTNTANGGSGFSPWTMTATTPLPGSGCNGFFSSSSVASQPHVAPGIDVDGQAWGIYANAVNCGEPTIATACRAFANGSLQPGGRLLLDMLNGLNDTYGSAVGFSLRNGNATNSPTDYATGGRFGFYLGGGDADYTVVDGSGTHDTGVPLTYSGLHLIFTLAANDIYTLTIISYGTGLTNTILGTLGGTSGSTLDSIALFNNDAGTDSPHDVFFNSLTVANVTPITYTINTGSSPPDGGTTSGGGTVNCGSNITVCATATSCYNFLFWSQNGSPVSTAACYSFSVTDNEAIVANFTSSTTDTVGDGISDCWRARYFPNVDPTGTSTGSLSCATCDADGTGQNNRFKYVAGLNPTNPVSVFVLQVQNVANQSTRKNLVYWPIATGCTYVVESTTDLVTGVWSPQPVSAPLTNGTQVTVMDPNATGPTKFYRMEIYNVLTNIVIQDSVGDGISDSWRAQYFAKADPTGATTNNLSCARCDADGTGQNNLFKYVTGLDPTNPASVFLLQITSPTNRPPQNNLFFTPLALNRSYTPQFTTNLASGSWFPLTTDTGPVTNNGNQVTITDTNPIPPQEFYRIAVSLP
jgi:glycosidase